MGIKNRRDWLEHKKWLVDLLTTHSPPPPPKEITVRLAGLAEPLSQLFIHKAVKAVVDAGWLRPQEVHALLVSLPLNIQGYF